MNNCKHDWSNDEDRSYCLKCGIDFADLVFEELNEKDLLIKQLEKQNAKLKEALQVYANHENWLEHSYSSDKERLIRDLIFIKCNDGYELAEKTLADIKGEGNE